MAVPPCTKNFELALTVGSEILELRKRGKPLEFDPDELQWILEQTHKYLGLQVGKRRQAQRIRHETISNATHKAKREGVSGYLSHVAAEFDRVRGGFVRGLDLSQRSARARARLHIAFILPA